MEAKEQMEQDLKNGRVPSKIFMHAPTTDNPFVTREAIEEARRSLPARLFRQYILADFVDDAEVFLGYRSCIVNPEHYMDDKPERWFAPDAKDKRVVIGADWAKTQDYTVFTAIDIDARPAKLIGFYRFQNLDYYSVMGELRRFVSQFKQVETIYHDKTGIGIVIEDLLSRTDLPYYGVTFTNDSKSTMVNKLMLAFQNQSIQIPHWATLVKELDAYEVSASELGKMKYSAPPGQHDDAVSSLMLANAAALHFIDSDNMGVTSVETISDNELPSWYNVETEW
jgi:hypothetical protein